MPLKMESGSPTATISQAYTYLRKCFLHIFPSDLHTGPVRQCCRFSGSSKSDMSCLRASIQTEDCIGTGWSLQSCAAHHHAVQPPTCLCFPHVVSQALSDEVLVRLEGPASFSVFPAHVVSWRGASAAIYRPVNVVGTGLCRHSLGTTLPGVGFSGVFWRPAVLPLRCSLVLSFPRPTHRTTEGGPGSVSFIDEECALCECAGPSHPLCLSDK